MAATTETAQLELPIAGMTCASCANRIERKLNKLEGVAAAVNYATEKATVEYDAEAVAPEDLLAAVEAAGYEAKLPSIQPEQGGGGEGGDPATELRPRLVISAGVAGPVPR